MDERLNRELEVRMKVLEEELEALPVPEPMLPLIHGVTKKALARRRKLERFQTAVFVCLALLMPGLQLALYARSLMFVPVLQMMALAALLAGMIFTARREAKHEV